MIWMKLIQHWPHVNLMSQIYIYIYIYFKPQPLQRVMVFFTTLSASSSKRPRTDTANMFFFHHGSFSMWSVCGKDMSVSMNSTTAMHLSCRTALYQLCISESNQQRPEWFFSLGWLTHQDTFSGWFLQETASMSRPELYGFSAMLHIRGGLECCKSKQK